MNNMLLKSLLLAVILLTASCVSLEKTHTKKTSLRKNEATTATGNNRQTAWGSDGMKDLNELTKHYVDCRSLNSAIFSFQLEANTNSQIRFAYQCTGVNYLDNCNEHSTTVTQHYKSIVDLFAEVNPQCPSYNVLSAFGLKKTTDGSQLRFTYTCCRASSGSCSRTDTASRELTSGYTNLKDHNAAVPGGHVMTGFQFRTFDSNGRTLGSYRLNYCAVNQPVYSRSTPDHDNGRGESIYLDRHVIDCRGLGAINYYRLYNINNHRYRYDFQCTAAPSINWSGCFGRSTPQTRIGGNLMKGLQQLDVQHPQCPANSVMTHFQFKTNPFAFTWAWYDYTCCPAVVDQCGTGYTGTADVALGNALWLERFPIQYKNALTGFRFQYYFSGGIMWGSYRVDGCAVR